MYFLLHILNHDVQLLLAGVFYLNIMTLDHLLKKLKKEKIKLLIELKADNNQIELSEKVINIVEQNNFENRVHILNHDVQLLLAGVFYLVIVNTY